MDEVLKWIILQPIAIVRNARTTPEDDNWGEVESAVELLPELPDDALDGIEQFSHVEVFYFFHQAPAAAVISGARHPRNNPQWPKVGILAQRGKDRPNRLGATVAEVVGRQGRVLYVRGLDAIDGTPVVDVKPVMREFLPRTEVQQPPWVGELMRDYWQA